MGPMQAKFEAFDRANPKVFMLYMLYTKQLIQAGHRRLSSKLIIERIRWESMVSTSGAGWNVAAGKPFLINNNFTALYARKAIALYPTLGSMFETRGIRTP